MVRYKVKTRYITREKLLALLKKNYADMADSDFRIVVRMEKRGLGPTRWEGVIRAELTGPR